LPIALIFGVIGLLLVTLSVVGDKAIYEHSLGLNVNLNWEMVLFVLGAIMEILGRPSAIRSDGGSSAGSTHGREAER
jgi:hypothetical protein